MEEGVRSRGRGKKRLREERGGQPGHKRRRRGESNEGANQTAKIAHGSEDKQQSGEERMQSLRESALQLLAGRPRMASLSCHGNRKSVEDAEKLEWKRALIEFQEVTGCDRERGPAHWLAAALLQKWGREDTAEILRWLHTTIDRMSASTDVTLNGREFVRMLCGARGMGPLHSCVFVVTVTYDHHVTTMGTLLMLLEKSGCENTLIDAITQDVKGTEEERRAAGVVLEALARECALSETPGDDKRQRLFMRGIQLHRALEWRQSDAGGEREAAEGIALCARALRCSLRSVTETTKEWIVKRATKELFGSLSASSSMGGVKHWLGSMGETSTLITDAFDRVITVLMKWSDSKFTSDSVLECIEEVIRSKSANWDVVAPVLLLLQRKRGKYTPAIEIDENPSSDTAIKAPVSPESVLSAILSFGLSDSDEYHVTAALLLSLSIHEKAERKDGTESTDFVSMMRWWSTEVHGSLKWRHSQAFLLKSWTELIPHFSTGLIEAIVASGLPSPTSKRSRELVTAFVQRATEEMNDRGILLPGQDSRSKAMFYSERNKEKKLRAVLRDFDCVQLPVVIDEAVVYHRKWLSHCFVPLLLSSSGNSEEEEKKRRALVGLLERRGIVSEEDLLASLEQQQRKRAIEAATEEKAVREPPPHVVAKPQFTDISERDVQRVEVRENIEGATIVVDDLEEEATNMQEGLSGIWQGFTTPAAILMAEQLGVIDVDIVAKVVKELGDSKGALDARTAVRTLKRTLRSSLDGYYDGQESGSPVLLATADASLHFLMGLPESEALEEDLIYLQTLLDQIPWLLPALLEICRGSVSADISPERVTWVRPAAVLLLAALLRDPAEDTRAREVTRFCDDIARRKDSSQLVLMLFASLLSAAASSLQPLPLSLCFTSFEDSDLARMHGRGKARVWIPQSLVEYLILTDDVWSFFSSSDSATASELHGVSDILDEGRVRSLLISLPDLTLDRWLELSNCLWILWERSEGDIGLYARRMILDHFLAGAYQRDACDLVTDLLIALCWSSDVEDRLAGPLPGVSKDLLLMAIAQHDSDASAFLPNLFSVICRKATLRTLSVPMSQEAPSTPKKRRGKGSMPSQREVIDWGRIEMRWIAREIALFLPLTALVAWHKREVDSCPTFSDFVVALLGEVEGHKEEQAIMCHMLRTVLSADDEMGTKEFLVRMPAIAVAMTRHWAAATALLGSFLGERWKSAFSSLELVQEVGSALVKAAALPMQRLLRGREDSGEAEALALAVSWVETATTLDRDVFEAFLKHLSDACLRVLSRELARKSGQGLGGVARLLLYCWAQLPALVRVCHPLSDASDLEMDSDFALPPHIRQEIPFVFLLLLLRSSERDISPFLGLEFLADWTKALVSAYCAFLDLDSGQRIALPRNEGDSPARRLRLLTAEPGSRGRLTDVVCGYVSEAAKMGGVELLLTRRAREAYASRLRLRCRRLARILHDECAPEASGIDIDLTSD